MVENTTYTFEEIHQQPALWLEVFDLIHAQKDALTSFLGDVDIDSEVVFTGAGSSFFIGEMVAPFFQKDTQITSRTIQTTEIVTHSQYHINRHKKTLLVSFARSGNSPESVAAVNLANQLSSKVRHLIITCNKDGALAQMKMDNGFVLVMPDKANDKSLAMTSSVTAMGLAALLIGRMKHLAAMKIEIQNAADLIQNFFKDYDKALQKISHVDYQRAVCLGSGPLQGVAREAHLKIQEMTDGDIICKFDSFLGFRHGPKAVVNDKTMMVYFFSNDDYARKYELDLVHSMQKSHAPVLSVGISNVPLEGVSLDLHIDLSAKKINEGIWTLISLVPLQLLAYYKSIALSYDPDSPSKSGAIHRVVQGVTIYNLSNKNHNGSKS